MNTDAPVPFPTPLVTATWLKDHLSDPDLVILDASIARQQTGAFPYGPGVHAFRTAHIPTAHHADLFSTFSDPNGAFPFTRPGLAAMRDACRALGIRPESRIVVYDGLNMTWAARVWWVLRAFGLDAVSVLNGGLDAWRAAGGHVETGDTEPPMSGTFQPIERPGYFVDLAYVKSVLTNGRAADLVCALRPDAFAGHGDPSPRRGHIPGSINIPFAGTLSDGVLEPARVNDPFSGLSNRRHETILYCGGGINAAGLALGMAAAGLPQPRIFDGSLNEWAADPTLPMEAGAS
jgi:thiosulfate/3-mercaptopyruvate sulfurtransferase